MTKKSIAVADNPLVAQLQARRAEIVERIRLLERDIKAAEREQAGRIVRGRSNPMSEGSTAVELSTLQARLAPLQRALKLIDQEVASAPKRLAAYESTLPALAEAQKDRDEAQAELEAQLLALLPLLRQLVIKNDAWYTALEQCAAAWKKIGGAKALGVRPEFRPVTFSPLLAAKFTNAPFVDVHLVGDLGNLAREMLFLDDGSDDLADDVEPDDDEEN